MLSFLRALSLALLGFGVLAGWAARDSSQAHRARVQLAHESLGRAERAVAALHEAKAARNAPEERRQNAEFDDATSRVLSSRLEASRARGELRVRAGAAAAAIAAGLICFVASWRAT